MSQQPQNSQQSADLVQQLLTRHAYEPRRARGRVGEAGEKVLVEAYVSENSEPVLRIVVGAETYEGRVIDGTAETLGLDSVQSLDQYFEQLAERYGLEEVGFDGDE